MKKVLALIVALALVVSFGCMTVCAAGPSKWAVAEVGNIVTTNNNKAANVTVTDAQDNAISEEEFAGLAGLDASEGEIIIIAQKDFVASSNKVKGKTIRAEFTVSGSDNSPMFVCYRDTDGNWQTVGKVEGPSFTVELPSVSTTNAITVVVGTLVEPAGTGQVAPQTGFGMTLYAAIGVFAIAGVTAIVVMRKKSV